MNKKCAALLASAFAAAGLFATDYYVNPLMPDNSGDGLSPATAKRTLAAVAVVATTSGDVIHAAPGDYCEGAQMNLNQSNRVSIASGVTLVSDYGAAHTFITGADSPTPDGTGTGCGPYAVRCVNLDSNAKLIGFTLRGGCVDTEASTTVNRICGGGVRGTSGTVVSDCVFTNCAASRGGGSYGVACSLRNRYIGCRALTNIGGAIVGGSVVNCFFAGNIASYDVDGPDYVLNCTFAANTKQIKGSGSSDNRKRAVNCIFLCGVYNDTNCDFENCMFTSAPKAQYENERWTTNAACRVVNANRLQLDAAGSPVIGSCLAVDAGDSGAYDELYPSSYDTKSSYDQVCNSRVQGATIDCGAVEGETLYELSNALAPVRAMSGSSSASRARVMSASEGTAAGDDGVTLPADGELVLFWKHSATTEVTRVFSVAPGAEASVDVYVDDEASPRWTVAAGAEDTTLTFAASSQTSLRFVCSGSGEARLHDFSDSAVVNIADANGALVVTGIGTGLNEFLYGEPFSFTLSRSYTSKMLLTGFTVNGEFVSFDSHDDGWEYVYSVDSSTPFDVVSIAAVYAATNHWYVDAVNGDDGNDGYRPGAAHAFKTIRAAMENPNTSRGDVVHAAPGDYSTEEIFGRNQTNRVVVAEGITLVADKGPSVTFITGKASDANSDGCASNSIRCVYLKSNAKIRGFTLRGGRGNGTADKSSYGGAVFGEKYSTVVSDCVITNCRASRGGGIYQAVLSVRNSFFDCKATANVGAVAAEVDNVINCVIDRTTASYDIYHSDFVANCTFGANSCGGPNNGNVTSDEYTSVVNCVFLKKPYANGCAFSNCMWLTGKAPDSANCSIDEACSAVAQIRLGDWLRVKSSKSAVVGEGDYEAYAAGYPTDVDDGIALDIDGRARVARGAMDLGASEYPDRLGTAIMFR